MTKEFRSPNDEMAIGTARRSRNQTDEASDERFSLSPQRGEGRGEGWERSQSWRRTEAIGRSTPHPHSLSPLRGEGGPRSRARESLRGLRQLSQIVDRKFQRPLAGFVG